MTNEELYRAFHKADGEYQDMLVSAYAKRTEKDHSVRMILSKNDVRLEYPEIWEAWNKTHEEWEVANLHMNERMIQAHEDMGFNRMVQDHRATIKSRNEMG